jgi:L-lactate dehydrogenase complex protein LldG
MSADEPTYTHARTRILERIRAANADREATDHPGDFSGWRPETPVGDAVAGFIAMFTAAGGEVVRVADDGGVTTWVRTFVTDFASLALGVGVPHELAPGVPREGPETAALAVSTARAAIAETGSLVMDARDGRRAQLLAPVHVVLLRERDVYATARDAFLHLAPDLPAALGLHSGPSKSADIGQVMVKGVHGPGRVVAVVIAD